MRSTFCLGLLLLVFAPTFVSAQSRSGGIITAEVAERHGLVREWLTKVEVSDRGRVEHITQHVSDTLNHMVFEVVAGNEVHRYSERDRNAFGEQLGRDGAKAAATEMFNELEAVGKKPVVKSHVIPEVFLYLVTNRATVQAINGETGETLWTKQIGRSDFPTTAVAANDAQVAVCNGSTIYVLDRRTGGIVWSRVAIGSIAAGPAIVGDQVKVPMISGTVEAYRIDSEKLYPPQIYRSQGTIYQQPIVTPRSVAWTTEQGHMYVTDAESGKPRFRLEASDTFVGGVAYLAPRYFYVASFDGYVYCLDEVNGNQLWRYSCGATISQTPLAVGETVYVVTDEGQLHAIDYLTGMLKKVKLPKDAAAKPDPAEPSPVWPVASGVRGVLAASPTKLYCLGRPGQMLILDSNSGAQLATLPIGGQTILLHNNVTDRLVLGTATGTLQSLHERQLSWPNGPYVHTNELEKQKAKRPVVVQATEVAEEPMKEAPVDPFGKKPMEADPFGPPKPADDPFGPAKPMPKEDKPVDDPFG